ncbi:hypothetical protein BpHYR1_031927 [Brachionus plicatilis]|uniref:Uncharacterized protein n=1 Tax=Brachionus plicatilis TaxID=10195 RepID=A0A3M7SF39_BRAPC|nr:hypothetical protein BpHYR1_031927 [Brachionus plicatilis]
MINPIRLHFPFISSMLSFFLLLEKIVYEDLVTDTFIFHFTSHGLNITRQLEVHDHVQMIKICLIF